MTIAIVYSFRVRPLNVLLIAYVDLFRSFPILVLLLLIFYALPFVGVKLGNFVAVTTALVLNYSGYYGEIFRAGIESVSERQRKAALSLGLTPLQATVYVVLPQGIRNVTAPLASNSLEMIKSTSVADLVSLPELLRSARVGQELSYNATPLTAAAIISRAFVAHRPRRRETRTTGANAGAHGHGEGFLRRRSRRSAPQECDMKCAVLDDYQEAALAMADWGIVRDEVEVTAFRQHFDSEDALVEAVREFEIIVLMRERTAFGRALFARLPKLRLLVTTGESNPSIDIRAAAEAGVVACGTPYLNHPTAELTWGLILSLLRHIPVEDQNIRRNAQWQSTVGMDLAGRVLGILGLGQIGTRVARIGAAFEMKVIAWSNNLTPQKCLEAGVDYVSKADLMARSDVLTIHTNLSARTLGLIGYEDLARMKRSAYLVNTSRAPIVDERGLIRALEEGLIAGAALDVFYQEPLPPDDPIRKMRRTVLTPHLGYVTEDNYRLYYGSVVENIRSWLDGKPIRELRSLRQVDRSL